jgi:hypothetical protein
MSKAEAIAIGVFLGIMVWVLVPEPLLHNIRIIGLTVLIVYYFKRPTKTNMNIC